MNKKLEADFKKKAVKELNKLSNCFALPISPGPRSGMKGYPDIIFWYNGLGGAIELKINHNKPTELQKHYLDCIHYKGGGIVNVCWTMEEVLKTIK